MTIRKWIERVLHEKRIPKNETWISIHVTSLRICFPCCTLLYIHLCTTILILTHSILHVFFLSKLYDACSKWINLNCSLLLSCETNITLNTDAYVWTIEYKIKKCYKSCYGSFCIQSKKKLLKHQCAPFIQASSNWVRPWHAENS